MASVDRLGVDYVDLVYVHRSAGAYEPRETLAALERFHEGARRRLEFAPDAWR